MVPTWIVWWVLIWCGFGIGVLVVGGFLMRYLDAKHGRPWAFVIRIGLGVPGFVILGWLWWQAYQAPEPAWLAWLQTAVGLSAVALSEEVREAKTRGEWKGTR